MSRSKKSFESMTLTELKDELRYKDLPVNGEKCELVERVVLASKTKQLLKEKLREKNLPLKGSKSELVMRLQGGAATDAQRTNPFSRKLSMKCHKCTKVVPNNKKLLHVSECWFSDGSPDVILLHVTSKDFKGVFELLLAFPLDANFKMVDGLLRDVWMECCGHLSQFEIYKKSQPIAEREAPVVPEAPYTAESMAEFFEKCNRMSSRHDPVMTLQSHPDPYLDFMPTKSMESTMLEEYSGDEYNKIIYQYDMGTTSELIVKILGKKHVGVAPDEYILMRNTAPPAMCINCGKTATLTMSDGFDWDLYCTEKCIEDDDRDVDYAHPFLNSPRTGHCGYGN